MENNVKNLDRKSKRCASCGGMLVFSPKIGMLHCDNCGSGEKIEKVKEIELHDYSENLEDKNQRNDWKTQNKVFKCSSCGANVILSSLEVSKTCPYCESSFVAQSSALVGVSPDGIIPFMFDKEQALECFKKGVKKKKFAPNKFKKASSVDTIKGIYISSFSFNANTQTSYDGRIGKRVGSGDKSRMKYRHISGTNSLPIKDVIVESSSHMDQESLEKIKPFDLDKAYKFNNDFMLGFMAETYDQSMVNNRKVSDNLMQQIIREDILSNYSYDTVSYLNMDTTYSNVKYSYYYLPTYKIDFKYKKKTYTSYVNGQTGKLGGKFPISPIKVTILVFVILLLVLGFGYLYLTYGM